MHRKQKKNIQEGDEGEEGRRGSTCEYGRPGLREESRSQHVGVTKVGDEVGTGGKSDDVLLAVHVRRLQYIAKVVGHHARRVS